MSEPTSMLTGQQLKAALMVAQSRLNGKQIAEQLGISRRTLVDWKRLPEFRAEVQRHLAIWRKEVRVRGIAEQEMRLHNLNNLFKRCVGIVHARARDEFHRKVPGGNTGLIVVRQKSLHVGEKEYSTVLEYETDTGLIAEMRNLMEHMAVEKGEWKQKIEHSGEIAQPMQVEKLATLTDDELTSLLTIARKLDTAGPGSGAAAPGAEPDSPILPGPGTAPPGTLPEAP